MKPDEGNNIQDLIAVREEARAKLRERLDDALSAKAGNFLINSVKEKYEQTHTPRVFERARDHFSSFTHNSYELHLSREAGAPRLFAVDLKQWTKKGALMNSRMERGPSCFWHHVLPLPKR